METKAIARFARIAPRKARMIVDFVRGKKAADAIELLRFTKKSGAPIVRKLIESAIANLRINDRNADVDTLYVSVGAVDKGPNKHLRRWRPRAQGRATQITKGVSHIQIVLTDTAPKNKKPVREKPEATEEAKHAEHAT